MSNQKEVDKLKISLQSIEQYKGLRHLIIEARNNEIHPQMLAIQTVKQILVDETSPSMQKLLSVRVFDLLNQQLIKDIMNSKNTSFSDQLVQNLLPIFEQIASQKSLQQKSQQSKSSDKSNQIQIQNSFFLMILECLQIWAQSYPETKYEEVYKRLIQQGIKFPNKPLYYEHVATVTSSQENINDLPKHLIDELYKERNLLIQCLSQSNSQQHDVGQLNSTYLNVKNIDVLHPLIHKELPLVLKFFCQYLKDYEIYMRSGMTLQDFTNKYVNILGKEKQNNKTKSENLSGKIRSQDLIDSLSFSDNQSYIQHNQSLNRNQSPFSDNKKKSFLTFESFPDDLQQQNQQLQQSIHAMHQYQISEIQQKDEQIEHLNQQLKLKDVHQHQVESNMHNDVQKKHQLEISRLEDKLQTNNITHLQSIQRTAEDIHKSYAQMISTSNAQKDQIVEMNQENERLNKILKSYRDNENEEKTKTLNQPKKSPGFHDKRYHHQNNQSHNPRQTPTKDSNKNPFEPDQLDQNKDFQQSTHIMKQNHMREIHQKDAEVEFLKQQLKLIDEQHHKGQSKSAFIDVQEKLQAEIIGLKDKLQAKKTTQELSIQQNAQEIDESSIKMRALSEAQRDQLFVMSQENEMLNQKLQRFMKSHSKEVSDYIARISQLMEEKSKLIQLSVEKDNHIRSLMTHIEDAEKKYLILKQESQQQNYNLIQLQKAMQDQNLKLIQDNLKFKQESSEKSIKKTPKRELSSSKIFDNVPRFVTPERTVHLDDRQRSKSTNKQENITLPMKHSQIIYPYSNAHDYYRDKIKKQLQGQVIEYRSWTPTDYLHEIQNYKLILLEQQNQILLHNNLFSLYGSIQSQMVEGQKHVNLNLKIISHQKYDTQIEIHFQIANQLQMIGEEKVYKTLTKHTTINFDIKLRLLSLPLSQSTMFIKSSTEQRQQLYLPICIISFFEFRVVDIHQFKIRWSKQRITRSKPFMYNQQLLQSAWDIQKFISNLIVLNPNRTEEFIVGIHELKFGGMWMLNGDPLFVKLTFTPKLELIVQVVSDDAHLAVQVTNIIQYIFN